MATAAVLIIGSEILGGKFADENGPYFIRRLRSLGVDLQRLLTIPDHVDVIVDEVRAASARFDHVFTTGGVGPTHDDVTFPAIARAFGVPLVRHPRLVEILHTKLRDEVNDAALRMAEVPEGAELWWDGDVVWPLVVMHNVAVLPGVPSLVVKKFEAVAHRFAGVPVHARRVITLRTEPQIADTLIDATRRWPQVEIGSYPRLDDTPRRVIVTMEGRDVGAVDACAAWLSGELDATG